MCHSSYIIGPVKPLFKEINIYKLYFKFVRNAILGNLGLEEFIVTTIKQHLC